MQTDIQTDILSDIVQPPPVASIGKRIAAALIDGAVLLGIFIALIPFSEGHTGQTLGKRALGIRVLKQNGDPANVGLSFVRHLFDGIDCFFLIGLIIASTNKERRRIGDLVAGTVVAGKHV